MFVLAFSFASCQKCMECTNESIISGAGEVDYEIEVCENDGGIPYGMSMDDYVEQLEMEGYRCYRNIW